VEEVVSGRITPTLPDAVAVLVDVAGSLALLVGGVVRLQALVTAPAAAGVLLLPVTGVRAVLLLPLGLLLPPLELQPEMMQTAAAPTAVIMIVDLRIDAPFLLGRRTGRE
jgi:hypothetical protein